MDRPLRVAHITEAFQGGVSRQLVWVAHALPADNIEPQFVISTARAGTDTAALQELRDLQVAVTELPMQRSPNPVADAGAYRQVKALLRTIKPDLVHTHASKAGMLGRRAAWALGIPSVHTPHVFAFEWANGVKRLLYEILERRAACWCNRIVLLSETQRQDVLNRRIAPAEKLAVVANGIDAAVYPAPSPQERMEARKQFGLPEDATVIGTAARLEPQKGIGHLLRAASILHRQRPETRFLLAGDGSLAAEHRQLAQDLGLGEAMVFCGNIEHMLPFYHALDAFVLASLWEGLPYVILEAQAAGLPVVATRTRGAEAALVHEQTGLLVSIGDEPALARMMLAALEDQPLRSRLLAQARKRLETTYRLDTWSTTLSELYRSVLDTRRRPAHARQGLPIAR